MKAALLSPPGSSPDAPEQMDEEDMVAILSDLEDAAADYVNGTLANARAIATQEYYQLPYEDERDDGLSKFVTSEVQDTIEWVLPGLLRMFTAGEDAVKFEPRRAEDEDGAEQATQAANYVFYEQNPGFLILHTAMKDALMLRNGAIEWYWDEEEVTRKEQFKGVSEDEITYTLEQLKAKEAKVEIVGANPVSADVVDMLGQVMEPARYDVEVKITKKEGHICIEAFPPDELLVDRNWGSPILEKCPYVCRIKDVSLSYLRSQGFEVDVDDLHPENVTSADADARREASGVDDGQDRNDEAMQTGRLRREWVLIDFDGDGIAERRYIVRLGKKVLLNEPCEAVTVATGVPIMRQHRWDGLSMADTMSDLQRLKTEVTRQMLNGLYFSVTPRNMVLTDQSGVPLANVDDLLNFTPGGNVRMKQPGAVAPMVQPWVGADAFPMLQYVDSMKDNRSGINAYFQGNDANALNKTKGGIDTLMSASQQRIELIARMLAETLVKPMFKGVFKLLLQYQMEPLAFKLRNNFVEINPQEWRDSYDMTIQVGLGTGNKDQMLMHLARIQQAQGLIAGMGPLGAGQQGPIVQPKHIYEVAKKMALNSGFKSPDSFFADPGEMVPPQPMPPPLELQIIDMQSKAEGAKTQANNQAVAQKQAAEQDFKAREIMSQQAHDKEMEILKAQLKEQAAQMEAMNGTRMLEHKTGLERQGRQEEAMQKGVPSRSEEMMANLAQLVSHAAKPKKIRIERDASGRATGASPVEDEPQGPQQ